MQTHPVDLVAQTLQVVEGLDPIRVAAIDVDTEPCMAIADPSRTRQIIRNLVTNAFRYGGPDIEINVRCTGGRSRLEVSDNGVGVAPEDEERIFEAFQRSSTRPAVADSVGLGLPISRLLSELMEGEVTYERRGGRSVFTLDLPAAVQPGAEGKQPMALASGA